MYIDMAVRMLTQCTGMTISLTTRFARPDAQQLAYPTSCQKSHTKIDVSDAEHACDHELHPPAMKSLVSAYQQMETWVDTIRVSRRAL